MELSSTYFSSLEELKGLEDIQSRYDAYFVDLWGVLHNGVSAYPKAMECLYRLKRANKHICLLSNAPRLISQTKAMLPERGVLDDAYHDIYTSGQHCFEIFQKGTYQKLGKTFYAIGDASKDIVFWDALDVFDLSRVEDLESADFILVTGTTGWHQTLSPYEDVLGQAVLKKLPMVCVNADKWVMREGHKMVCAGLIAQRYQTLGGEVHWHGKPAADVFENAMRYIPSHIPKNRILMIGDSLTTDILGGKNFGIDQLWIGTGIYQSEIGLSSPQQVAEKYKTYPNFYLDELQ